MILITHGVFTYKKKKKKKVRAPVWGKNKREGGVKEER